MFLSGSPKTLMSMRVKALDDWDFLSSKSSSPLASFFMATFVILVLVFTTLRNAGALQRNEVDAGMAAARIYQLLKTNQQIEVSGSGDFGGAYSDYSCEFESGEYQSNGLLRVKIVVKRRGSISPVDTATIWVYDPDAKTAPGQVNLR
jgi:hypothetical protein